MSDQEQPKRRGRPPKYAGEGKRQNFSFRIRDAVRDRLAETVKETGRSLSEEIEWRIERSYEWEDAYRDAQSMKQSMLTETKARMAEIEHGNTKAVLHRLGWQVMHTDKGDVWAESGVYTGPKSGFVDTSESTAEQRRVPSPAAPPNDLEATIKRAVVAALRETLPPSLTNRAPPSQGRQPDLTPETEG